MKEWKKVKLGDISEYVNSKIDIQKIDNNNYISTENMVADRGGIITASSLPNLKSVNSYKSHDILISNIRPYFKKIWLATFEGGCSTDVLNIRGNEYIYFKYLYYILSTDKFFDFSLASAKGTKMPRGDKSKIMDYPILLPPLAEQEAIAEVLSSLDDKIELNNKINKTFEEMAQAIFKNWFIDFEFPNENGLPYKSSGGEFIDSELGKIPKGWKVGTLEEIATDIICGKTPPTSNHNYYGSDYQLNKMLPYNAIMVSCIASAGIVALASRNCQTNQQINSIICKDDISPYYIFITMKNLSEHIKMLGSSGSTTHNLNKGQFAKVNIIVPADNFMKKFNYFVTSMFDKIRNNQNQNLPLTSLRDTLLPKLMSGEVRVMEGK